MCRNRIPVSLEKTHWACTNIGFLGLLIDTVRGIILIPDEKLTKAKQMVRQVREAKRIKLVVLQQLCGVLNFLGKCIVPGRAFTRRLYAAGAGITNEHHHLPVTSEMRLDLDVWQCFLQTPDVFCRPFVDFARICPDVTDFHTDASGNNQLGAGGHCGPNWFKLQWDETYFSHFNPSIDYLELYAVTVGIKLWLKLFKNRRITIFCDNLGVVHMINNNSSTCARCMVLIRIIVLESMTCNACVFADHVPTRKNKFADMLSRLKYQDFWAEAAKDNKKFNNEPEQLPVELWPMTKLILK